MSLKPAVSIIIPAYNAEKYIKECLDSVLAQTFRDFEALVVNDASTDSTPRIVARYAEKDSRIKLIGSRLNKGVSASRNKGASESKGEYLYFLDSDDLLLPIALESMMNALKCGEGEICITALGKGDSLKKIRPVQPQIRCLDYYTALKLSLYQKVKMNSAGGMLIKSSRFRNAGGFSENIRYEDLDAFYRFFEGARNIVYIRQPLYLYRQHASSFMNRWSAGRLDVLDVTDRMAAYFAERHPDLADAAQDRRFSAHFNMLVLMLKNEVDNPKAIARCMKVIKKGRLRALTDPNVRLKNKIGALASLGGIRFLKLLAKSAP